MQVDACPHTVSLYNFWLIRSRYRSSVFCWRCECGVCMCVSKDTLVTYSSAFNFFSLALPISLTSLLATLILYVFCPSRFWNTHSALIAIMFAKVLVRKITRETFDVN